MHHLPPQGWNADLFEPLKAAGGKAYSNYAVGYNNVDVPSATERGIAVGNTPGAQWVRPWPRSGTGVQQNGRLAALVHLLMHIAC